MDWGNQCLKPVVGEFACVVGLRLLEDVCDDGGYLFCSFLKDSSWETEKSVTKMYGSTLLALRGGGWGSNFQEKSVRSILMAS